MTTVVQTTYRPQIARAVAGLVANSSLQNIKTYVNETAGGIGFGLAVSQGTADKGVTLGGSAFRGVSVRDVTLALAQIDPLSDTPNTLDTYGLYSNVAVLLKGDIWVVAGCNVSAGTALAYDTTTGQFTTSTTGVAATGTLTFTQQPAANATVVVGTVTHTFKTSGATGQQSNIGPTLGDTLVAAAAVINASPGGAYNAIKAAAYPPSPGGAGQGSGANQLLISAVTPGTAGNSLTLTAGTTSGVTASATTLLGGTGSSTAISNGRWAKAAIAGELTIISLA